MSPYFPQGQTRRKKKDFGLFLFLANVHIFFNLEHRISTHYKDCCEKDDPKSQDFVRNNNNITKLGSNK
jgi:hypothetical protein